MKNNVKNPSDNGNRTENGNSSGFRGVKLRTMENAKLRTMENANFAQKKVLLIVDYNIQILNGQVACDYKIETTLPTIDYILKGRPRSLVITTHLGRPEIRKEIGEGEVSSEEGKVNREEGEFSTRPLYEVLNKVYPGLEYKEIRKLVEERESEGEGKSEGKKELEGKSEGEGKSEKEKQEEIRERDSKHHNHPPSTRPPQYNHPQIIFTDNRRFYKNLNKFSSLFDLIVNEAFGCSHRPLEIKGNLIYSGFLFNKEVEMLMKGFNSDLIVIGGAKVEDKMKLAERFLKEGGRVADRFLKGGEELESKSLKRKIFAGGKVGLEMLLREWGLGEGVDEDEKGRKRESEGEKESERKKESEENELILPVDFLVKNKMSVNQMNDQTRDHVNKMSVQTRDHVNQMNRLELKEMIKKEGASAAHERVIDVGPESLKILKKLLGEAKNVLWNGPLGKIEDEGAEGTRKFLEMISEDLGVSERGRGSERERVSENQGENENQGNPLIGNRKVIAGGGETLKMILKFSKLENFIHVSTGGGAMLAFLTGQEMPGIERVKMGDY